MDKKLVKNYIYNILYQIVKIVLPVVIVPYTMGHLGESTIGISDFANNIAAWFILFGTLGINIYGNREIAKVRDNKEDLSRAFFEILTMQIVNMTIALILYIAYTILFVKQNQIIYYLCCLTVLSSTFDITWFYYGIENFKIVSIRNTAIKVIGVILIMTLVKEPSDLWLFVVINSGTDLLGHLFTYSSLKKYIYKVKFSIKEAYRKHLKATFILFVPTIAINVYTLLDQTMLGALIEDKGEVALYKTAQSFVKIFLYFITSIGSVMLPRIANVYHKNKNSEKVEGYINTTFNIAILLAIPMMIGMATVAPSFIPWYLPKQLPIATLIQVSSPIILFISISNVFGIQYLVPTGHNKEYTISVVSGAVINFFVNLLLIPKFAGVGAAIGSVIAEFTVTFVQFVYIRKDIHIKSIKGIIKCTIASILMGLVVIAIGEFTSPSIIVNIIQVISGFIVYVICLFVLRERTLLKIANSVLKRKNA